MIRSTAMSFIILSHFIQKPHFTFKGVGVVSSTDNNNNILIYKLRRPPNAETATANLGTGRGPGVQ